MAGSNYEKGSLSLAGTIAMGTGVMIGAGIFVLTGQIAEFAGTLFPLAFLLGAAVSGFSAYSYVKVSNKYPSAGGIAMILKRAYGGSTVTGAAALMMAASMIINESLVARTFGTYTLRAFGVKNGGFLVPALGIGLIVFAFLVNIAGNRVIGSVSKITTFLKVAGILIFALGALWAAGFSFEPVSTGVGVMTSPGGFLAAIALAVLAFKGFTTITNSGDEVEKPEKNVGRAIMISLAICLVVYLFVAWAVASTLSVPEIIGAKDYSLAEAARPAFGDYGVGLLTVFFDLSRIASLGAIFYLVMDMAIHWGVFRHLRKEVEASGWVLIVAIVLDAVALSAFLVMKALADPLIIGIAVVAIIGLVLFEKYYLAHRR